MKRVCLLIFILSQVLTRAFGQSEAMYAQYMFNGLAINPAYAGSHGAISLTALARFQGAGLEGSPGTQTFSGHAALQDDRMGVGFSVINDKIGVTRQSGIFGAYSYSINFDRESRLSFGLQAGVNFVKANFTELRIYQPGDPNFNDDVRETKPNFGAGVFYTHPRFFAGLSMPQMLGTGKSRITQYNPMIVTGGAVFKVNHAIKIKPNFLVKLQDFKGVEYNINTNVLIQDVLWLGVSYRPNTSLNFLFEALLTNQLRLGYAYEAAVNEISRATNGSHEIMLNYRFRFTKRGAVDPRYF